MVRFSLFETSIGWCGLVWRGDSILASQLPEASEDRVRARFVRRHPEARETPPDAFGARAMERIQATLDGGYDDLRDLQLELSAVGAFESHVYEIVRGVPPGETTTYGEIAAQTEPPTAAQAVGLALGRNPFAPIVPCHRVVASGRRLGGFSAAGGLSLKRRMLEAESRWTRGDLFGQGPATS